MAKLLGAVLSVILAIIATQDIQIFPGAFFVPGPRRNQSRADLPANVESITVSTSDGQKLETWRLPGSGSAYSAVIFHGNAGDVANFFDYQLFFQQLGITSYDFDYRGFGISSGWPSEHGLYSDSEAVVNYVLTRENITAEKLIFVGVSIGGGPASYAAKVYGPKALLLIAPFESLPQAIAQVPGFGLLKPFAFYNFPVADNVRALSDTCLVVAHGNKDTVIPFEQGRNIAQSHPHPVLSTFLAVDGGGHNDSFSRDSQRIAVAVRTCLGEP